MLREKISFEPSFVEKLYRIARLPSQKGKSFSRHNFDSLLSQRRRVRSYIRLFHFETFFCSYRLGLCCTVLLCGILARSFRRRLEPREKPHGIFNPRCRNETLVKRILSSSSSFHTRLYIRKCLLCASAPKELMARASPVECHDLCDSSALNAEALSSLLKAHYLADKQYVRSHPVYIKI